MISLRHSKFPIDIRNSNWDILVEKNNIGIQNLAFFSVKKNDIFIVFISLGIVHNQYLKYIEIRI